MFSTRIEEIEMQIANLTEKKETLESVVSLTDTVTTTVKDIMSKLSEYQEEQQIFKSTILELLGVETTLEIASQISPQPTPIINMGNSSITSHSPAHRPEIPTDAPQTRKLEMSKLEANSDIARGYDNGFVYLYIGFDREKGKNGNPSARGWKNYIEKRWGCECDVVSDFDTILDKKHILRIWSFPESMLSALVKMDFSMSPGDNEQIASEANDSETEISVESVSEVDSVVVTEIVAEPTTSETTSLDTLYDDAVSTIPVAPEIPSVPNIPELDLSDPLVAFDFTPEQITEMKSNTPQVETPQPKEEVTITFDDIEDEEFTVI